MSNGGVGISQKQEAFLNSGFARINLLEGSVRSGKTWISLVAWALHVAAMPDGSEFLMVGKTLTTLRRNCLGLLHELEPSFTYSLNQKKAMLYGKVIWLEGADKETAENKIRGMTLAGAYFDEMTLIPKGFYYMTLSRLSVPGAKLFATTNPDSPMNYVYREIIQNPELNKKVTKFLVEDNPFLEKEYIENLKREYSGVFYQRYLLGEWVLAEGLVYPMYDNTVPTVDRRYDRFCVSVDYGIQNPTVMILFGRCEDDGAWYAIKEYYHSGRETNNQKTDDEYYDALVDLCKDYPSAHEVIVDPSAASFIALIRKKGKFIVHKAKNEVLEGIQNTAACLTRKDLFFNDCCVKTIQEFGLYSWKPDSMSDTVVKENDHCLTGDTFVETLFGSKRIDRLVGKFGFVWSYNKRGKRCIRPFYKIRKTQRNQPIYKIVCENGKIIRCTGEHKILTADGWKEAKNLTEKDEIIDIFQ